MLRLVSDARLAWVRPVVAKGLDDVVAGDSRSGLRAQRVYSTAIAAEVTHNALELVGSHMIIADGPALATPTPAERYTRVCSVRDVIVADHRVRDIPREDRCRCPELYRDVRDFTIFDGVIAVDGGWIRSRAWGRIGD